MKRPDRSSEPGLADQRPHRARTLSRGLRDPLDAILALLARERSTGEIGQRSDLVDDIETLARRAADVAKEIEDLFALFDSNVPLDEGVAEVVADLEAANRPAVETDEEKAPGASALHPRVAR